MTWLRYTLVSDGSSDRVLMHPLNWLLERSSPVAFRQQWADLARLPRPPRGLAERVQKDLDLYPCDLLFVHRDAEREPSEVRISEIRAACAAQRSPPVVCVVPVRMQEAWFLFDVPALRAAAGNPRGSQPISLPNLRDVESEPDPKLILHDALRMASGLAGRRLKSFNAGQRVHRLAELITDFSPLLALSAFGVLDRDLRAIISEQRWNAPGGAGGKGHSASDSRAGESRE